MKYSSEGGRVYSHFFIDSFIDSLFDVTRLLLEALRSTRDGCLIIITLSRRQTGRCTVGSFGEDLLLCRMLLLAIVDVLIGAFTEASESIAVAVVRDGGTEKGCLPYRVERERERERGKEEERMII